MVSVCHSGIGNGSWRLDAVILNALRCYGAAQENVDIGLNRLSSISKDGRAANLTSAPGDTIR